MSQEGLIKGLKESMGIDSVTSSFSTETKRGGIKSSSFVAYTVKCRNPEGWTLEEARLVEAILAARVSKDVYADLGSRQLVDIAQVSMQQKMISANYKKLVDNLTAKMTANAVESDGEEEING